MPEVSILTVTLNRFEIATQYFGPALEKAGEPFNLMAVDNGSEDSRIIDYIKSFGPVYHACLKENAGYAPALNQMLLRLETPYACVLDPDILPEQPNWLANLVSTYETLRYESELKPGSSGVRCIFEYDEEMVVAGKKIFRTWNAFGIKFFHRYILEPENVGYFYEGYGKYGNEDIDMNYRLNRSGFTNYYIPGLAGHYNDAHEHTPYRTQKWKDLEVASKLWEERRATVYDVDHNYYIAPPALKDWPDNA